ncbi:unnamed protein product [Vitrella brassicaformis CCMP3155]|uniref:C-type lectin domain-containing protein n=1 Tax=Vitrella brassicaformis (strain CCMP3155) TaxID=1169540 RepID=A0A0G4ELP8_VITBC|nr:unnamed protein product [Vitrella brassicaformis CCMP3155]|eukprot:CEL98353.1 unnamed protein product [Vitrella brassicaformis CCMP3155]
MSVVQLTAVVLLVSIWRGPHAVFGCPDTSWTQAGEGCYKSFFYQMGDRDPLGLLGGKTWTEANRICMDVGDKGSSLATIRDEYENFVVLEEALKMGSECWIGLRKYRLPISKAGWRWVDSTATLDETNYLNWGEELALIWRILPPQEKCVTIRTDGWGAQSCWGVPGARLPCFVCESPADPTKAPEIPPDNTYDPEETWKEAENNETDTQYPPGWPGEGGEGGEGELPEENIDPGVVDPGEGFVPRLPTLPPTDTQPPDLILKANETSAPLTTPPGLRATTEPPIETTQPTQESVEMSTTTAAPPATFPPAKEEEKFLPPTEVVPEEGIRPSVPPAPSAPPPSKPIAQPPTGPPAVTPTIAPGDGISDEARASAPTAQAGSGSSDEGTPEWRRWALLGGGIAVTLLGALATWYFLYWRKAVRSASAAAAAASATTALTAQAAEDGSSVGTGGGQST